MDKWMRCRKFLKELGKYTLMLLLNIYLQKMKMLPSMTQLQAKCKEMQKIREDYAKDTDWLYDFNHDLTLEDLGLQQMEDFKVK